MNTKPYPICGSAATIDAGTACGQCGCDLPPTEASDTSEPIPQAPTLVNSGVGTGELVRALHRSIIGIGWTDLGTAYGLICVGSLMIDAGRPWGGCWAMMLGVMVFLKAPRPNANRQTTPHSTHANE